MSDPRKMTPAQARGALERLRAAYLNQQAELDAATARAGAAERALAEARAIVEGRTVPSPQEAEAHALAHPVAFGVASTGAPCDAPVALWLCVVDGEGVRVLALARADDEAGPFLMAWSSGYGWCGTGDIRRAWPLDATGRPCAWPVVAPEGG